MGNLEAARKLIDSLSGPEQRALYEYLRKKIGEHPLEKRWNLTAEVILGAIDRSPDITQRGVRGVVAEAVFEAEVVPLLKGWKSIAVEPEKPYDFVLEELKGQDTATIQVKLQRSEKGKAKLYARSRDDLFVVEVQKTRTGKKETTDNEGTKAQVLTRPYSFGDFDILAVSMQPSTGDWSKFMFTVGNWLIPRKDKPALIEIFQPVSATRNAVWTDDLQQCLLWFKSGERRELKSLTPPTEATKRDP